MPVPLAGIGTAQSVLAAGNSLAPGHDTPTLSHVLHSTRKTAHAYTMGVQVCMHQQLCQPQQPPSSTMCWQQFQPNTTQLLVLAELTVCSTVALGGAHYTTINQWMVLVTESWLPWEQCSSCTCAVMGLGSQHAHRNSIRCTPSCTGKEVLLI